MYTIALHGDLATGDMLRRDMGDPCWVDEYFDGQWGPGRFDRSVRELSSKIQGVGPCALVGYSRGASVIARLSIGPVAELIRAAVVYEGPVIDSASCGGCFPVLMIWNDDGAVANRTKAAAASIIKWRVGRRLEIIEGHGKHVEKDEDGKHCHGWDKSLNVEIRDWLRLKLGERS